MAEYIIPSPYVQENGELIVLTDITFPRHYLVQQWLNDTERNDEFTLVITGVEAGVRGKTLRTVAALSPTTDKGRFYWKLRGDQGAMELQQEIFDFSREE